ncbi:hypothetical protein AB0B25_16985 [Nocardia sp. NPDC049190]|uniref:hypothetical protein n=1 Tax=Nocardia sp. NPDC049190 TaxID=3155650 RepID=UPI0033E4A679
MGPLAAFDAGVFGAAGPLFDAARSAEVGALAGVAVRSAVVSAAAELAAAVPAPGRSTPPLAVAVRFGCAAAFFDVEPLGEAAPVDGSGALSAAARPRLITSVGAALGADPAREAAAADLDVSLSPAPAGFADVAGVRSIAAVRASAPFPGARSAGTPGFECGSAVPDLRRSPESSVAAPALPALPEAAVPVRAEPGIAASGPFVASWARGGDPGAARFAASAGVRVELSTAPPGLAAALGLFGLGAATSVRPAAPDVAELVRAAAPDSDEFVVAADLGAPAPGAGAIVGSEDGAFVVSALPVAAAAAVDDALFGPATRPVPVAPRVLAGVLTWGTPDGVPLAAAEGFDPAPDLFAAPPAAAVPVDPCRAAPAAASDRCPAGDCEVAAGTVRSSFPATGARSVTASAPAASAGRAPSRAGIFSSFGSDTHTPRSRNS